MELSEIKIKKKRIYKKRSKLYYAWTNMKTRCNNPNYKGWKNYGGRGIKLCSEWQSFKNFKEWAFENGYSEGLTIERIDVNGGYNPDNCTWATIIEQGYNKTDTKYVNYNGKRVCLAKICNELNLNYKNVWRRMNENNISFKEAIKSRDNRRKVKCIGTNKVYESVEYASRQTGIPSTTLARRCEKGLKFTYIN